MTPFDKVAIDHQRDLSLGDLLMALDAWVRAGVEDRTTEWAAEAALIEAYKRFCELDELALTEEEDQP